MFNQSEQPYSLLPQTDVDQEENENTLSEDEQEGGTGANNDDRIDSIFLVKDGATVKYTVTGIPYKFNLICLSIIAAIILGIFLGIILFIVILVHWRRNVMLKEDSSTIVILVAIDGFRYDYRTKFNTPNLNAIAQNGVYADALIPVFPSSTFPNMYTIVTGLYPESHGIVATTMYDPDIKEYFNSTTMDNPYWYESGAYGLKPEPIWVTAEKNGIKTASIFWFGSNVPIHNITPTYYQKQYDSNMSTSTKIKMVFSYLDKYRKDRPRLITLYINDIDAASHRYGIDSNETKAAVEGVDASIGLLVKGIADRSSFIPNVQLIIVSDHGMVDLLPSSDNPCIDMTYFDKQNYPLTALLSFNSSIANVFNDINNEQTGDAPGRVSITRLQTVLENSQCSFNTYLKEELQSLYYSSNRRIGPIVLISDEGYIIQDTSNAPIKATHGYDPKKVPSMNGIFIAQGSKFKKGVNITSFSNIHLYSLMSNLLNITEAPNNGSISAVSNLLAP
jgi:predicted AlkP superfamily pyrophosphatase or phosphodiesterase